MNVLKSIDEAIKLINEYPEHHDLDMPSSLELIEAAQEKLKLKFPESYFKFLKHYGCGIFEGIEFYGLIHNDFENSGIPDVVWLTLDQRKNVSYTYIKEYIVPICADGMGDYYAIDTSRETEPGENPIIIWRPGVPEDPKDCEVVANSFGEFFYNMIKQSVEMIEEEKSQESDE